MQVILSSPLIEPPSRDAPPVRIAPGTRVTITDEDGSALYQSLVSSTDEENNVRQLEETMPQWLAECVLTNKLPVSLVASKISFVLVPWQGPGNEETADAPSSYVDFSYQK